MTFTHIAFPPLSYQNLALALSDMGTEVKNQGRLNEAIAFYEQVDSPNDKGVRYPIWLGLRLHPA